MMFIMKYKESLVELVRSGKAQVQVDADNKWIDLNRYISNDSKVCNFTDNCNFIFFNDADKTYGGWWQAIEPIPDLPIVHAKEFLAQEPEVKWVEVRNNFNQQWNKAIFIADIGVQFKFRYFVVEPGKEDRFINGESNLDVSAFKQMREIVEPEPLTHSEIEKLIGKPFKYVEK